MHLTNMNLFRLAGQSMSLAYSSAPGYEARLMPGASLILSGEPVPDLNYALIYGSQQADRQLHEFTEVAKLRNLPLTIMVSPDIAPQLGITLNKLGLQYAEHYPFMVYKPVNHGLVESSFQISRVDNREDLSASNAAAASAFGISAESLDRAFGQVFIDGTGLEVFIARQDGKIVSTVQTSSTGSIIGIWGMATAPDQQRKGGGRALLNYVIDYHCQRGTELFYLGATPAGKPLYDRVGFQTETQAEIWVFLPNS